MVLPFFNVRLRLHQGSSFRAVYQQLVAGVPDRLLHCVEDGQRSGGSTVEYFPNIFYRLSRKAFVNLVIRVKQLFPPQDPWVHQLPEPLGTLFEVCGSVEIKPIMLFHGPFKYP